MEMFFMFVLNFLVKNPWSAISLGVPVGSILAAIIFWGCLKAVKIKQKDCNLK